MRYVGGWVVGGWGGGLVICVRQTLLNNAHCFALRSVGLPVLQYDDDQIDYKYE